MKEVLSRTECAAMRGIAIMAIMLHNYCHFLNGIVRENEYTWTPSKCYRLWDVLQHPDELLPIHLLSFFGHYGVPVFLFLSGFGLVMKYEKDSATEVSLWRFVRYNYLKLFRILVVGFVVFILIDAITPGMHRYQWMDVVGMLGMFSNLFENPSQVIWPGPYWYFGLTLQLYIVYRLLLYRWRHWSIVVLLMAVCWLLQEAYIDDREMLERLRYNFIGGMLPFGIGVLIARYVDGIQASFKDTTMIHLGVLILSIVLITFMSMYQQAWLWVPAFIVVGTIALVKVLPQTVLNWLIWIGSISAAIFVSHPIIRKIIIRPYIQMDLYAGLLLYIVAALLVGWLLTMVINKIPKPKL